MSKFRVGDRVRALRSENASGDCIEKGRIYTVGSLDDAGDPVLETDHEFPNVGWRASFELYAKAGEFVVGDKVVIHDAQYLAERKALNDPFPDVLVVRKPYRSETNSQDPDLVWFEGQPWAANKCRVRLAPPEEIAAAGAETPALKAQTPTPQGVSGGVGIPAVDFDFSTIKAGDEVLMKFTVARVAPATLDLSHRGDAWTFFTRDVHSVIPAPKPKTLRERAIEAAGEAWTATIGGQNVVDSIVDAVLAEVEKGDQ